MRWTLGGAKRGLVRASVESFFSDIHRNYLKPRGYHKKHHAFIRELDGYTEAFAFQGSAWNDSVGPWRFYINVTVAFPDIPNRPAVRIEHVVAGTPQHFDLPEPAPPSFAGELAVLLGQASDSIASQLPQIREAFLEKRYWVGF